jgi:hypothetical protein
MNWSLESRVWGLEFGAWGLEHGVWSKEFEAWTLKFGAWSLDFVIGSGSSSVCTLVFLLDLSFSMLVIE